MAKDKYHEHVREALIKDGWTITDDPFRVSYGGKEGRIDLGAEKLFAAEKGTTKIVVEVKSFIQDSVFYEFHGALGQYRNYLRLLRLNNVDRVLYLALPLEAYEELFLDEFGKAAIEEENLKLIVYQPVVKEIIKWIK